MQLLRFAPVAFLIASVSAVSVAREIGSGACATPATSQCCSSVVSDNAVKQAMSNAAGFDNIEGLGAFNCIQVPVQAGAAQNTCKSNSVCCSSVSNNGLFAMGCTPLSVN